MAVSKVIYGGETLVDLTSDTVTPDTLAEGITAHNAAGEAIIGNMPSGGVRTAEVYIEANNGSQVAFIGVDGIQYVNSGSETVQVVVPSICVAMANTMGFSNLNFEGDILILLGGTSSKVRSFEIRGNARLYASSNADSPL